MIALASIDKSLGDVKTVFFKEKAKFRGISTQYNLFSNHVSSKSPKGFRPFLCFSLFCVCMWVGFEP
jgi:hypothetical protein